MFSKIIKAAIGVALLATGSAIFAPQATATAFGFLKKNFLNLLPALGLAYINAKGSDATTTQNLGIKSAGISAIAPRNVVYGKTRVGGTVVFRGTSGSNNFLLHNVIALAGHEINDLKKIFIDAGSGLVELDLSSDFASATENGETVYRVTKSAFVNTDNDNAYTSGGLIKVTFEKGDQTTSNGFAVANIGDAWTTDHKLQGIAYVYISCVFDVEKFTRYPQFSFEIEGKKVVDPRVHATNRTFSSNPALIIRDYLKDSTYGFGATDSEINDEASGAGFKQASNDCDDDITTTGSSTEDRFTLNGEFSSNEEPQRILEHMLSACGGHLTYNNGQFSLFVGKGRTASGTITDDKVLAPIQITTKASGMGTANGVKATYVRPSDDYIGGEITPYKDSTFLTEDTPSGEASANYEKFLNLSFPYTHTTFTAQRLARMALNYGRKNQTLSVVVPIEFLSHQVGDVVNFTNERLGYDGKDFEIVGMTFEFMNDNYLALRLELKEYDSAIYNTFTYTTDPSLPTAPTAGDTSVSPPTSLTLTEFVKTGSVIKSAAVFVKANWTNAVDEKIVKTVVMYKRSTDSNFDAVDVGYPNNHFHIKADIGTTYDVKVSHVSVAGISSAETAVVQITVGAEAVTLNTGTIGGITIAADKLYEGTGTFNNSNTGFYLDDSGQFSLKDKLSFNGTTLTVSGNLTVENTIDAGKITLDGQDLSALISTSGSGTGGTFSHNTKITQFKWIDGVGTTHYGLFVDNTNAQGRIGIGTASNPSSAIHVYNTTPHIRLEDADTSEYVRIKGDDGNMVLEVDLAESDANSYLGIDVDNGERARFTSTGLGIGTTSPSSSLHVKGGSTSTPSDFSAFISNATLRSVVNHSNEYGLYMGYANSSTDACAIQAGRSNGTTDPLLLNPYGDNVGIGTNSPSDLLEISQATDGATIRISSTQNNSSHSQTTPFGSLVFYSGDASGGGAGIRGAIKCYPTASSGAASDLAFTLSDGSTNDTEVARFTQEGYLGIGTTSPSSLFHLKAGNRDLNFTLADSPASGDAGVQITAGASDYLGLFAGSSNGELLLGSNGSEKMRIDSSGNVSIGTTSPDGKLGVQSATGEVGFNAGTSSSPERGNLYFDTDGSGWQFNIGKYQSSSFTSIMTFTDASRVGIGTTSPVQKLHLSDGSSTAVYQKFSNDTTGNTNGDGTTLGIDADGDFLINNKESKTIKLYTADTERMRITSSGEVNINQSGLVIEHASSPFIQLKDATQNASFKVYAQNSDVHVTTSSSHPMIFDINNSEKMRIDTSGNVGIGTSSPASGQKLTVSGDATVLGTMTCTTISKITGSFKIDHPLKPKTHSLVHSFVESPQADNTYSGKLRLVKGQAELNLDEYFGMTEGTIVALNRDFRVFTTNESNWDNVKGKVKNNILYIESNNPESMAEVSWLVIGERQDKEIHESELTNDEGKIILEPSK